MNSFEQNLQAHGGQPKQVEHVCMDMSAAFAKDVRQSMLQTAISYDRFHVVALANRAMDEVRRAEMKEEGQRVRQAMVGGDKQAGAPEPRNAHLLVQQSASGIGRGGRAGQRAQRGQGAPRSDGGTGPTGGTAQQRPALVRDDCDYGNEPFIAELEQRGQPYLFKLRQTKGVKNCWRVNSGVRTGASPTPAIRAGA